MDLLLFVLAAMVYLVVGAYVVIKGSDLMDDRLDPEDDWYLVAYFTILWPIMLLLFSTGMLIKYVASHIDRHVK